MPWPDVNMPHGWHLNPDRVPVPPVQAIGHAREVETHRRHAQIPSDLRHAQIPSDLRHDPAYMVDSLHWARGSPSMTSTTRRASRVRCFHGAVAGGAAAGIGNVAVSMFGAGLR